MRQPRFYDLTVEEAATALSVDASCGLDTAEAARRLAAHGRNSLPERRGPSVLAIALHQLIDATVLLLLAAALVSGLMGDLKDTAVILVIVMLNAVIATVQEVRARRAIAALRKLGAARATVVRNAIRETIPAEALVPGDVVLLEAGSIVPADMRLAEAAQLRVNEAMLTGESAAVHKQTGPLGGESLALGDRTNLAYKGTIVAAGRGRGLVIATGLATELGRLSTLVEESRETETPLQQRLAVLGRWLSLIVVAVSAIVFAAGLLRGEPLALMFLTAVSLAVAAIPEALPATLTIALAIGARRMSEQNALARRLAAVEALGSVNYICSDKTGTLTQDRMHAERLMLADGTVYVPGADGERWSEFFTALALCNDVLADAAGNPSGDSTEVAAVRAAAEAGFERADLAARLPRTAEFPFETWRKAMTTVHARNGAWIAYTKGAPEAVVPRCRTADPEAALAAARALAASGLRVLAVASRRLEAPPGDCAEDVERDLDLLGFIGIIDPPRAEAAEAVAACRRAGIVPVMITGDHPDTAQAIAVRLGLGSTGAAITGADLIHLSDDDLGRRLDHVSVFARVDPAQKIRIVEALQKRGAFVAMTGDGVNDAPALRRANIGIAMGRTGTDAAREASDLVLVDDNFATIVAAVREGRRIYDNIRKFLRFMLTGNSAEIWTMFLAPFAGLPVPLLPIHILWINLVTDSLPALALAAEPAEGDTMRRPPRPPQENILGDGLWQHCLWVGLLMGGTALAAQAIALASGSPHWQTMVFTVLTLAQLGHVLAVRSERQSLIRQGLFSNLPLLGAVTLVLALQLAAIYLPVMNALLDTVPLDARELATCVGLALIAPIAVEIEKAVRRRSS